MNKKAFLFNRRKSRVRRKVRSVAPAGRLRLSIFRSNLHIYAQIIDDKIGETLVSASTLDKELELLRGMGGSKTGSEAVGKLLAERALGKGVRSVVFDRGGYLFHGRVRALAQAARENGLDF